MRVELELGFRSSFNFVPEGDYRVPVELREELTQNGFEVGIHDLRHDGRLYQSRREFSRRATRINRYLTEWPAVGFRSAFMLHKLDWLHELDIQYDASTFDTDPFEPQPEGRHTIFPLWIQPIGSQGLIEKLPRAGYVELPYTLPQDSTLFLLLREESPDIWLRKLDWIADHGGMALVITHPDYMTFSGSRQKAGEYPIELYQRFLEYIRQRYSGAYWHALPKQVAAYALKEAFQPIGGSNGAQAERLPGTVSTADSSVTDKGLSPVDNRWRLRGKRAAVLLFSYYPADPRPRRAAEALAMEGVTIDLICLQKSKEEPRREIVNGVNVFRVPLKKASGREIAIRRPVLGLHSEIVCLSRPPFGDSQLRFRSRAQHA